MSFSYILDYLELILLAFFAVMSAVALVVLIQPTGNAWAQYTVVVAAILLTVVLGIKFALKWRRRQTKN